MVTLVPPAIGPDFGNTEEMDGLTYVYVRLDCAGASEPEIFTIILTEMLCIPPEE